MKAIPIAHCVLTDTTITTFYFAEVGRTRKWVLISTSLGEDKIIDPDGDIRDLPPGSKIETAVVDLATRLIGRESF